MFSLKSSAVHIQAMWMFIFSVILFAECHQGTLQDEKQFTYPNVRRNETVADNYYGTWISDPYRWLETQDSPETKIFAETQNNLTAKIIGASPIRDTIKEHLEEMTNYEKFNCPVKSGGKYYYSKNSGLENQDVFYVQDSLNGQPRLFLNPNELSANGTESVYGTYFSHDGGLMAYEVQRGGSDWITLYFRNTTTRQDLPDKLDFLKFTYVEWSKDNAGVFYGRYPESDGLLANQKIYYHTLGTSQADDILLVEFPNNPEWFVGFFALSHENNYLVVIPAAGIGVHTIYLADLDKGIVHNLTLIPIVEEFVASYEYITNVGSMFYFKTDKDAPNRKIVGINVEKPEEENWATILQEHQEDTLDSVTVINDEYLVVNYIRDISNVLELYYLSNGKFIKYLSTEDAGTSVICKINNKQETELFFSHTSYLTPQSIYTTNVTNDLSIETRLWKEPTLRNFNKNDYQSTLVFYNSSDGQKVPMYISHKKNLELNGKLPTKLHAYGGYGVSTLPSFKFDNAVFMQNFDGVVAVANIRGGGEYGNKWWNDGRLLNKQKGFNDFHAAAEYLHHQKYTNPSKLFSQGESNGGLLVAATLNQRRELYGAVIAEVGVMDMLRFQKFTIGHAWCSEFGCSDDKVHFNNLRQYSPLHNIWISPNSTQTNQVIQYPPVLVLTGDNDDRVLPLHSYKYIAELQYQIGKNPMQTNPVLLRVESDAGHGLVGKPISKKIAESADIFAFLAQNLGYEFHNTSTQPNSASNIAWFEQSNPCTGMRYFSVHYEYNKKNNKRL